MSKRNRNERNRPEKPTGDRERERRQKNARRNFMDGLLAEGTFSDVPTNGGDAIESEPLRAISQLPRTVWAFYHAGRGELFCPLGNQPSYPFTTHIFWDAINHLEAMMESAGLVGIENPARSPGHYLVCFRTKELAETFRSFTGIDNEWEAAEQITEVMLRNAIGVVPFTVYVNDYIGDESARESGFRWRVCHAVGIDNETGRRLIG